MKIRPLEKNDAYVSVEWRNDPEIWLYTTFKTNKKITIEDELRWIEKVLNDPHGKRFAIIADGVYVGNIYVLNISNNKGEYHIFIGDKKYWGKGIAKEASLLLFEYSKRNLKLKKLYLKVHKNNQKAIELYKKLGFGNCEFIENDYIQMVKEL